MPLRQNAPTKSYSRITGYRLKKMQIFKKPGCFSGMNFL
jgi:hypothetical protein